MASFLSQNVKRKLVYPWVFGGGTVSSDYTLTVDDLAIGVDTSSNNVKITVPTASTVPDYPRSWFVKKMSDDENTVIVELQTPNDSMYGSDFYSVEIHAQGEGVEVTLNKSGEYTFSDWSGIDDPIAEQEVTTQTPVLASTTLTMNGTLESLGGFNSIDVYFRYRDVTTGTGSWTETTKVTKTSAGNFSDTATVTAGHDYEVQACGESSVSTICGAVLRNTVNYYSSITEAQLDGLVWGSRINEGSGLTSSDVVDSKDISWTGVTWSSDTINGNTINKVVFGSSDYGESSFAPEFSNKSYTILLAVKIGGSSGDHTVLNFGRNVLSLAGNDADLQLEIKNKISTWSSALPFTGIKYLWIRVRRNAGKTKLDEVTSTSVTNRINVSRLPNNDASYTRIARGSSGDANHQDFEYLDNGEVRCIWIWKGNKSNNFMKDVTKVLSVDGGFVV